MNTDQLTGDKGMAGAAQSSAPGSVMRGRRSVIGVGVPLVATLASRPALGTMCFTPSRSLSRNTSISQQGKWGECSNAQSPGNYKDIQTPGTGGSYSWPTSCPPSTRFHSVFAAGNNDGVTKFTYANGTSKTFGQVIVACVNKDSNVLFHLIGAYLNTLGGGGSVIPPSVMTPSGITNIWREYVTNGYYSPLAGVKWYAAEIKNYLLSNGIVK